MKKSILVVAFLVFVVSVNVAGANEFKPGKWEMTMVTQVQGMDEQMAEAQEAMKNMSPEQKAMMDEMMGGMGIKIDVNDAGMTTTITQCLTDENPVPEMKEEPFGCETTHEKKGNTYHFKSTCAQNTSEGSMTYSGNTVKGNIESQQMINGKKSNTKVKMNGKYLGPCDK